MQAMYEAAAADKEAENVSEKFESDDLASITLISINNQPCACIAFKCFEVNKKASAPLARKKVQSFLQTAKETKT